jgi:methylthioribose-1-phosphate isomerase
MAPLISIKSTEDKLEIVNQLLLPHTTEFIEINSIEEAHDAIKTMKVRPQPADLTIAHQNQRFGARPLSPHLLPCPYRNTLHAV